MNQKQSIQILNLTHLKKNLKMRFKTIFLFLSLVLWASGSHISDYLFPTDNPKDINNYWELKKIIYSICIILAVLAGEYKNQLKKLIALIFVGILSEDISDRIQGITYFEYSDLLVLDVIIISSIYIIYKDDFNFKAYYTNFINRIRR